MHIAVIDIGTNTVLLLVASFDAEGTITTLLNEQRVIRVGEGIQSSHRISSEAEGRLVSTITELTAIARDRFSLHDVCVFGTSVFRRATNTNDVVVRVKNATGVEIEMLSGEDEAQWTFLGAVSGSKKLQNVCVVDIGGGSTEVVVGNGEEILFKSSADLGVVVLREEFFLDFPPSKKNIADARTAIVASLEGAIDALDEFSPLKLVAVAGTPTTLAALAMGLTSYDATRVDGAVLSIGTINLQTELLLTRTLSELLVLPCVDERRADVLPAGALILKTFMNEAGFDAVQVSDRGVRYGIAMREWRRKSAVKK